MEFNTREEVENLTDAQALEIIRMAWEALQANANYSPFSLDDSGDYLNAALDNYYRLFHAYWDNDGDSAAVVAEVKKFLLEDPCDWGASDGEIRYEVSQWVDDEAHWALHQEATHRYWEATHPIVRRRIKEDDLPLDREEMEAESETPEAKQWEADVEAVHAAWPNDPPEDVMARLRPYMPKEG